MSRHLKRNTQLDLVSCDIHQQALEFLEHELGIRTLASSTVRESFSPSIAFDVVFALSFFSHLPKSSFGRWLRALFGAVKAPGNLIFTTHGLESHKLMGSPPFPADGFYFKPFSRQLDLNTAEYGNTIPTPAFVAAELFRQTGVSNVTHTPAFWWGHQDLWIVKREQ